MSDIDFDELDKAVNSLMSQNEGEQPQSSEAQNPDAMIGSISSPVSAPVTGAAVANTPATPAASRTPGRFMDIVAPPSSRRPVVRPTPVDRQETTLSTEPLPVTEPVTPAATSASFEADSSNEPALAGGDVPVGINHDDTMVEDGDSDPVRPELDDLKDVSSISTMDSIVSELQDSPMQSPFLSDVAVDKRPLGAVDGALQDVKDEETELDSSILSGDLALEDSMQDVEQNEIINPVDNNQPAVEATTGSEVPPEMSAEILALESAEIIAPKTVDEVDSGESGKAPVAIDTPSATIAGEAPANAMAAGDIKPQYTPSEVDTPEPSAIFDTAVDLPQPLQHQEKKKSGWMVVVWIVLLIVIGVAGGVAAWFFLLK